MKIVIQTPRKTISRNIKDYELQNRINDIKKNFLGNELSPLQHEVFRYKLNKGVIVIYRDNRVLRTKNSWYEIRGLANLARINNTSYYHNVKLNFKEGNTTETEIDGLDTENEKIMVEVKKTQITQEWIDFYEKKRKKLGMKKCYIIAPSFHDKVLKYPNICCYIFNPDYQTMIDYYENDFKIPEWFSPHLRWRHIRILLDNGRWYGIKRKLTKTAKHTETSKLVLILNNLFKRNKFPMKIYYTLSPMILPIDEYYGKGKPLPKVIAALDVDSNDHDHIISSEGYCLKCLEEADEKAFKLSEMLNEMSINYLKLYSGSKGFHFYLLDEDKKKKITELPNEKFSDLLTKFKDKDGEYLTDNINFRDKDGLFDAHRIFKLPHSLDMSTGILVREKFEKLRFKDNFKEL